MKKKIFIFSLFLSFFITTNTHALKHEYTQIPVFVPLQTTPGSNSDTFNYPMEFQWNSSDYEDIAQPAKQYKFYSRYDSNSGKCIIAPTTQHVSPYNEDTSLIWSVGQLWIRNSRSTLTTCDFIEPFGSELDSSLFPNLSHVPEFNEDSIDSSPSVPYLMRPALHALLPYSHAYNYLPLNPSGGERPQDSGLKMSTLYTDSDTSDSINYPSKMTKIVIPYGSFDESIGGALTQNRMLKFTGQFNFNSVEFTTNALSIKLHYQYMNGVTPNLLNGLSDTSTNCTGELIEDQTGKPVYTWTCALQIPSSDFVGGQLWASVEFTNNNIPIFITSEDWSISNLYVTTDGDSTPGAPFNPVCTGSNCNNAPNNPNNTNLPNNNWINNLVNLFHFDFLNPFAPLLTMFSHGNYCGSIPIIAGMLNAPTTQFCPFFSNSVRDILTPVMSISSMVILFGFVMRWINKGDSE